MPRKYLIALSVALFSLILTYCATKRSRVICKEGICYIVSRPPKIKLCYVTPIWTLYSQAPIRLSLEVNDPDGLDNIQSVTFRVISGKDTTYRSRLFDNGKLGDVETGDGVYSANFYSNTLLHPYGEKIGAKQVIFEVRDIGNVIKKTVRCTAVIPKTGLVEYTPKKPKVGDTIAIRYDPAYEECTLRHAREIYVVWATQPDNWIKTKMLQSDLNWIAHIPVVENTKVICFGFTDGKDLRDNNCDSLWQILIYNEEGKPVRSAHLHNGKYFTGGALLSYKGMSYCREIDFQSKINEFEKELELYPDNYDAYYELWKVKFDYLRHKGIAKDSAKMVIKSWIEEIRRGKPNEPGLLFVIAKAYSPYLLGEEENARELCKEIMKKFTKSKAFENAMIMLTWLELILGIEGDVDREIKLWSYVLERFPENIQALQYLSYAYRQKFDTKKEIDLLEKLQKLCPDDPQICERLGFLYAKQGINLDRAEKLCKRALRIPDESLFKGSWEPTQVRAYPYSPELGLIYYKKGMYNEAKEQWEETKAVMDSIDLNTLLRLAECYVEAGENDRAFETYLDVLIDLPHYKEVLNRLEQLYVKEYGSKEGFDDLIHAKLIEMGRIRVAPNFTLRDSRGNRVSLSDYRGKIVILYFWSARFPLCVEMLSHLQKIQNRFGEEIAVLTINGDVDRIWVGDIIRRNKYTFKVLFDDIYQTRGYWEDGIRCISYIFVIDRRGAIRATYSGHEPGIEELLISEIKRYQ